MKVLSVILGILISFLVVIYLLLRENSRILEAGSTFYDELQPRYQHILSQYFCGALGRARFAPRRALWLFKAASLFLPWSVVHGFVYEFLGISDPQEALDRLQRLSWKPGGRALMVWLRSFYLFGSLAGAPTDTDLISDGRRWD